MSIGELVLISIGLATDAFAVSICKGLNMKKINYKYIITIALFFGGFQALMPLIGWALGIQFKEYIVNFDHWIAFALLGFIGGKMIFESFKKDECNEEAKLIIKELFVLAIATSIDALAVGITFSFFNVNIWLAISLIGIITFVISFLGVLIGKNFGCKLKNKAEFLGGFMLILIGLKILLEHLGILIL